jgi:hypothetical protein
VQAVVKARAYNDNARVQVQLSGPGLLEFSRSLGQEDRAFVRRRAREIDAAKLPLKERQAQAIADNEAIVEEQKKAEDRVRRREEREVEEAAMIEEFEPILNLDEFQALPASLPLNDFLRRELVWLRVVGGDKGLPPGLFKSVKKERMKELVVEALQRRKGMMLEIEHDVVMADDTGEI